MRDQGGTIACGKRPAGDRVLVTYRPGPQGDSVGEVVACGVHAGWRRRRNECGSAVRLASAAGDRGRLGRHDGRCGPGCRLRAMLLRPARVFDGETHARGLGRARARRAHRGRRAAGQCRRYRRAGHRPARRRPSCPASSTPHARPAAPLQRDELGRPGAEGAARRARRPRDRTTCAQTLLAGFTTLRDLGTEGAGYADVGLKQAVEQGIIPGPRLLVATRAIVATGSYGPKGFAPDWRVPQGAEEADGDVAGARRARPDRPRRRLDQGVRRLPRGAPHGEAAPTFSLEELKRDRRDGAQQRPRRWPRTRCTEEGMRRAALAGVETIEHGDGGTPRSSA